ncbi:MAG: TetR/AcrR family transcriptional regulator [Anaerolineales bacterium]|nr:TetR/AcrR family transcriptional regulator [Anaerolineales bacterium]
MRTQQHPNLQRAILDTAWRQISRLGASALNLRGIARELGITAPAIYNYFPDRDALVTALIVEAYTSFGDAQLAARDSVAADDLERRLDAIGWAYRQWAITYPERYQLIFGTPIPNYVAPMDQVFPVAARALSALVSVIDALRLAGRLNAPDFPSVHPDFQPAFEQWKQFGGEYHPLSLSVAILIWARVHGLVSLEIGRQIPAFGEDGAGLYRYEMRLLSQEFILPKENPHAIQTNLQKWL